MKCAIAGPMSTERTIRCWQSGPKQGHLQPETEERRQRYCTADDEEMSLCHDLSVEAVLTPTLPKFGVVLV